MIISVIIPTFNRAHCLKRAVDSVLAQTFLPYEIIIVDDGSTDETDQILESYKNKIHLLKLATNHGVSFARNRGIEKSQGQWISFLDSDDEWLPIKLQKQVELIQSYPQLKVVHGEEIWIRNGVRVNAMKKHEKYGGHIFSHCLPLCAMSPSTILIHKSVFEKTNFFREDFPVCEDYDLWLKITSQFEVGFVSTPIIRKYGGHSDQLSHSIPAMDYFRILGLTDILQSHLLSHFQRQEVLHTIKTKLEILRKGAVKHNNQDLLKKINELEYKIGAEV